MVSVQFRKNFTRPSFCGRRAKKLQTFSRYFFDNGFQKIVLSSLLLFSCACYYVDLDDIQWNEVATSTARNFNSSWLLYLHFFNMINLCSNIWFIKISKCQQLLFWRKSLQKHKFFIFLKGWFLMWMLASFERLLWPF